MVLASCDVHTSLCLEPAARADRLKRNAVIYLVDISEVPDFSTMYELYDPCTVMFFFRNKVSSCCAFHVLLSLSGDSLFLHHCACIIRSYALFMS